MDNFSYERLGFHLQNYLKHLGYEVKQEHGYWWLYKNNEIVLNDNDPFVVAGELVLWLVAAGIEFKYGLEIK